MPAPGKCGIKLNPYRAQFVKETKDRSICGHCMTSPFKKARENNSWQDHSWKKSCTLLEGGQLNKGEGGEGKQRGKKGEVGSGGKEREMKEEL